MRRDEPGSAWRLSEMLAESHSLPVDSAGNPLVEGAIVATNGRGGRVVFGTVVSSWPEDFGRGRGCAIDWGEHAPQEICMQDSVIDCVEGVEVVAYAVSAYWCRELVERRSSKGVVA